MDTQITKNIAILDKKQVQVLIKYYLIYEAYKFKYIFYIDMDIQFYHIYQWK